MTAERERPLLLVAEDEHDILTLIAIRLERAGFDVVTASDGAEALRLAKEVHPDLALLDVMMPHLDGFEVTEAIKSGEETKDMPVILLTARVQEADLERGAEVGADDYVKKPFDPDELRGRIERVLHGKATA
jgi:DNA-binding response OmpR family regulator